MGGAVSHHMLCNLTTALELLQNPKVTGLSQLASTSQTSNSRISPWQNGHGYLSAMLHSWHTLLCAVTIS